MSKQRNVALPKLTAEHRLGKSVAVKRKLGRPKEQTEANLGGSKGEVPTLHELPERRLSDMCDELGHLGKSSDGAQKRSKLGEVLTLQELLTEGVGWFTIKPAVTIVAVGRRRYSYHRCVDCWKKGSRTQKDNMVVLNTVKQRPKKSTAFEFYYEIFTLWVTAFDEVNMGITVKKFNAFDDDGRKRVARGVCGMKCYMTIETTHGVYTNYTVKSM